MTSWGECTIELNSITNEARMIISRGGFLRVRLQFKFLIRFDCERGLEQDVLGLGVWPLDFKPKVANEAQTRISHAVGRKCKVRSKLHCESRPEEDFIWVWRNIEF